MEMIFEKPKILTFPVISGRGSLYIYEEAKNVPFLIKRVFTLTSTEKDSKRGFHAHKKTSQILICLKGRIEFTAENPDGEFFRFIIDSPNQGIYIPPNSWHEMNYEADTIQMVLASTNFEEADYLRTKESFYAYYTQNS